jgi:hypothetical protein
MIMLHRIRALPFSFIFSLIAGLLSLGLAVYLRDPAIANRKGWGNALLTAWALCPPVWFLYEFVANFPHGHPINSDEMDRLKHLQSLARNIWIAFLATLAIIMELNPKSLLTGGD